MSLIFWRCEQCLECYAEDLSGDPERAFRCFECEVMPGLRSALSAPSEANLQSLLFIAEQMGYQGLRSRPRPSPHTHHLPYLAWDGIKQAPVTIPADDFPVHARTSMREPLFRVDEGPMHLCLACSVHSLLANLPRLHGLGPDYQHCDVVLLLFH